MKYFLGLDGGGTQSQAAIVSDTLEVIGRGVAGPSNHYRVGAEQAAINCLQAADSALRDAARLAPGISRDAIAAWGFGLAGVRRENDLRLMRSQLGALLPITNWVLETDAVAAHSGAFAGDAGIVLSAGTGAVAFGVDDLGERYYSDGWGPLLGDEGSGYWIGLEALRAACRAHDGRAPKTRLAASLLNALNLSDMSQLVPYIYALQGSAEEIAQLSQVVLNLAETGGQTAVEIRDHAASHLARTVASVVHAILIRARERAALLPSHSDGTTVQAAPVDIPIALRGGLFEDDFFRASVGFAIGEMMVEMKRDFLPIGAWKIIRPQYDAAFGAALLAQRA